MTRPQGYVDRNPDISPDGSHLRQVTRRARPANGEDTDPQWSPDGRRITVGRRPETGGVNADPDWGPEPRR